MDSNVTSRIKLEKRGVNAFDKDQWPTINEFLIDAAIRLHRAFKEPVQALRRVGA